MHMFDKIFCICVPLSIYLPDDDIVEVKTCRRNMSDMIICYWLCGLLDWTLYDKFIVWNMDHIKFRILFIS